MAAKSRNTVSVVNRNTGFIPCTLYLFCKENKWIQKGQFLSLIIRGFLRNFTLILQGRAQDVNYELYLSEMGANSMSFTSKLTAHSYMYILKFSFKK